MIDKWSENCCVCICAWETEIKMSLSQCESLFYLAAEMVTGAVSYTVGDSENWYKLSREQFGNMQQNRKVNIFWPRINSVLEI